MFDNYKLVFARRNTVRYKAENVSIEKVLWDKHLQPIFDVDVNLLCDFFSYSFNDNHPYTKTILEYKNNKSLTYDDSFLKKYYDSFQPKDVRDIFWSGRSSIQQSAGLFSYRLPWDYEAKTNHGEKLNYSGPMDIGRGREEYKRLTAVYDSIEKKGYHCPESSNLFNSNQIQGYFLKKDKTYRFIVLHGKHRIAALIGLGYQRVPVTFELTKPRVVDINTIDSWPMVVDGRMSVEDARFIFEFFFKG